MSTPEVQVPAVPSRAVASNRRCAKCGGVAKCRAVTQIRRGLPTGTTFAYACEACASRFTIASPGGHVFNALGATICVVLGFSCLPTGLLLWLMALGLIALSVSQLLAQARNPLIADGHRGE